MKLEVGKTYVTQEGDRVKIAAIDMDANKYHQAIGWVGGVADSWRIDGKYFTDEPEALDITAEAKEPSAVELLGYSLPVMGTLNFDKPRDRRFDAEGTKP